MNLHNSHVSYWKAAKLEMKALIVLVYGLLFLLTLFFAFPLLWMFINSFMDSGKIGVSLLERIDFSPWLTILKGPKSYLGRWLFNSFFTSAVLVTSNLLMGSTVAYYTVFIFKKSGRFFSLAILLLALLPVQMIVIPHYKIVEALYLDGTLTGLVLPHLFTPFTFFLFYKYFDDIDPEIIDFARSDGCNDLQILWHILYPVTKPVFIVSAILLLINWWNTLLWPLIMLRNIPDYTINLALTQLVTLNHYTPREVYAVALVSIIPVLALFLTFKKIFIEGLTLNQLRVFY